MSVDLARASPILEIDWAGGGGELFKVHGLALSFAVRPESQSRQKSSAARLDLDQRWGISRDRRIKSRERGRMERFDRWMLLFALMGLLALVATLAWILAGR